MSKLRPIAKICQLKSQSLDFLANKVPLNLRGWVAVAQSPHWFAWSNCPAAKNEQCSRAIKMPIFRSKSKKGRRCVFLEGGVLFFGKQGAFLSRCFSCNRSEKLHKKGPYLRMCTNPKAGSQLLLDRRNLRL